MIRKISIIGCGWLGLPLAKYLIDEHHAIKGSTTSIDKLPYLKSVGIDAFYLEVTEEGVKGDIEKCLSQSEILILNIPPSLRNQPENNFVKQMRFLIPFIETSTIEKVLFISSTSVYGDDESIPTITESTIPNPDSESGKQLLEAETLFQKNPHFETTILRLSGLFGDNRHPAKHLSGKTTIKNSDAPVNLIHLSDCIRIVSKILQNSIWNETFNAATTPHPSRKVYYNAVCKAMNLPLPQFEMTSNTRGKLIDSKKLARLLNYEFQVKLNN